MKKKRKKTDGGRIIKKYGEHFPISRIPEAPRSRTKGTGIYALYKGDNLVYIGLTKRSIRARLGSHLKTKKGRWDNFSFYLIRKLHYIKDIETLILRIADLKLNNVKGTFPRKYRVK